MSKRPDVKKSLKYGAPALLDLGSPTKCGELRRQQRSLSTFGLKKWHLCYVILAGKCLYVFENKNSTEAQFASHVSSFECAKTNGSADVDGENVCFIVRFEDVDKKPLIFACDVEKSRQKWIKSIEEVILKVKKFSADSAYCSGGSLSNYSNGSLRTVTIENEGNYHEIDESEVTPNAVSNQPTKLGTMTRQPTSIQPVSDCEDSGFINVGIHSSPTTPSIQRRERVDNDDIQRLEDLKLSVPESTTSDNPYEPECEGNLQNIYENTEDAFTRYSNMDIRTYSGHTRHNTSPSSATYGTERRQNKPRVAPKPKVRRQTDTQQPQMTTKTPPTQPVSIQQDSGHLMVGGLTSSTRVKTLVESCDGMQLETRSKNSVRLQDVTTRYSSNSDSSEESPIYENANFGKVFERKDYFCSWMHIKHLKSKPAGTFFVRPGKETTFELAIKTDYEDGVSVFRIYKKDGFFYLIEGVEFSSLDKLIGHYSCTELPSKKFRATLQHGYNNSV